MKEFLEDSAIEENRIAAEVTLYADKIAFSAYDMVESYAERRCRDEVF